MKSFCFAFALLVFLISVFAVHPSNGFAQTDQEAPTEEPRLQYELSIDGVAHKINANKEFEIELKKSGPAKVKLVPNDFRVFKYAGLRFQYPAAMVFEADHDEDLYAWSMDSSSAGILIYVFPEEVVSKEEFVDSLKEHFESPSADATTIKIGETEYEAIAVGDDEGDYVQTVIELECTEGARLVVFGDFLEDSGEHSKEFMAMLKMIGKEFKVSDSHSTKN